MSARKENRIQPRNGRIVMAGIVARISGCPNQKEQSLEDQVAHGKAITAELHDGPAEFKYIATKGGGVYGGTFYGGLSVMNTIIGWVAVAASPARSWAM